MGNTCTVCCTSAEGQISSRLVPTDHQLLEHNENLKKNIHLIIKIQAIARGNKERKEVTELKDFISTIEIYFDKSDYTVEKFILKELGYELYKIQDQPHKFIISYFKVYF